MVRNIKTNGNEDSLWECPWISRKLFNSYPAPWAQLRLIRQAKGLNRLYLAKVASGNIDSIPNCSLHTKLIALGCSEPGAEGVAYLILFPDFLNWQLAA